MNILSDFYDFSVLKPNHQYSESGVYKQIDTDCDNNVRFFLILRSAFVMPGLTLGF